MYKCACSCTLFIYRVGKVYRNILHVHVEYLIHVRACTCMYMFILCMCVYVWIQSTPLMLATTHGKPAVVRVLLKHGSDATQRMEVLGESLNCLEAAIEKGKRYTCTNVYTCIYIHVHVYVHVYTYMYIRTRDIYMYLCMTFYTCIGTYMYIKYIDILWMHSNVCTCILCYMYNTGADPELKQRGVPFSLLM